MEKSKYANKILITKPNVGKSPLTNVDLASRQFIVEDYWINLTGESWMYSAGNPAAMEYKFRIMMRIGEIPVDDKVLYGKIGGLGHLFHESELILDE